MRLIVPEEDLRSSGIYWMSFINGSYTHPSDRVIPGGKYLIPGNSLHLLFRPGLNQAVVDVPRFMRLASKLLVKERGFFERLDGRKLSQFVHDTFSISTVPWSLIGNWGRNNGFIFGSGNNDSGLFRLRRKFIGPAMPEPVRRLGVDFYGVEIIRGWGFPIMGAIAPFEHLQSAAGFMTFQSLEQIISDVNNAVAGKADDSSMPSMVIFP